MRWFFYTFVGIVLSHSAFWAYCRFGNNRNALLSLFVLFGRLGADNWTLLDDDDNFLTITIFVRGVPFWAGERHDISLCADALWSFGVTLGA